MISVVFSWIILIFAKSNTFLYTTCICKSECVLEMVYGCIRNPLPFYLKQNEKKSSLSTLFKSYNNIDL